MDILHPLKASNESQLSVPTKEEHKLPPHAAAIEHPKPAGLQGAPLHGGPVTYHLG